MSKRGRKLNQTRRMIAARKMGLPINNRAAFMREIQYWGADFAFRHAEEMRRRGGGWIVPGAYASILHARMIGERRVFVNGNEVNPDSVKIVSVKIGQT